MTIELILVYEFLDTEEISLLGSIDNAISYSYTKSFVPSGDFSLNLPYTEELLYLVSPSNNMNKLIQIDDFLGVVYKVDQKRQTETKRIQVSGKDVSNILTHYNISNPAASTVETEIVIGGHLDTDIQTRFDYAHRMYSGTDQPRHLPAFIVFDESKYENIHALLALDSCPMKTHTWFDYLQTALGNLDYAIEHGVSIGFKLVLNSDNQLELKLFLSKTNRDVLFHSQIQSFMESEYIANTQSLYTLCEVNLTGVSYTSSTGETAHKLTEIVRQTGITQTENHGAVLKSYVMDVDGSNLSSHNQTSLRNYAKGLGRSFLRQHQQVNSYSLDIDLSQVDYVLGVDYDVGDKVLLVDTDLRVNLSPQLSSYTKSSDSNGQLKIKPVFGFEQATLSQVLSRNQIV